MHKGINTTCDEGQTLIPMRGGGFDVATFNDDGTARTLTRRYDSSPCVDRGPDVVAFTAKDYGADAMQDLSPTLRAGGFADSHQNGGVMPAVAYSIMPMNSGKDYKAREVDVAQPIMAGGPVGGNQGGDVVMQPTAYDLRCREGGSQFEGPHDTASIRAASGGSSRSYLLGSTPETMYGVSHASAQETHPDQALRELREAVGAEAFAQWGLGILDPFQSPEILRSKVHGGGVRCPTDERDELGDDPLSCTKISRAGAVRALWEAGCDGRSPRGWKPSEQLAVELVAHLSELPYQRASAQRFLLGMWRASEGLGILREALSALQEAWRPIADQTQSAQPTSAVRRLTPDECEKLQGFLPGYTQIPWRNKPADQCPDGPRYKALGNSMAVPVMRWIGERIQAVDAIISAREAA